MHFRPGDLLRLRSSGRVMRVVSFGIDARGFALVRCEWFVKHLAES